MINEIAEIEKQKNLGTNVKKNITIAIEYFKKVEIEYTKKRK
jgi:hypothetical protein